MKGERNILQLWNLKWRSFSLPFSIYHSQKNKCNLSVAFQNYYSHYKLIKTKLQGFSIPPSINSKMPKVITTSYVIDPTNNDQVLQYSSGISRLICAMAEDISWGPFLESKINIFRGSFQTECVFHNEKHWNLSNKTYICKPE